MTLTPKAQAEWDYQQTGGNENPYPYRSQKWWDYELAFSALLDRELRDIRLELKNGTGTP